MNPRQFEELVCEHFRQQGYIAEITSYNNDYGIDVFAIKGREKIGIQAKMYGNSTRKINRQMVMELHGAKDFFDCTKAVIATNGTFLSDALTVAEKLKIEILHLNASPTNVPIAKPIAVDKTVITFEQIWESYNIPLEGKTIARDNRKTNQIIKADWSGIERLTSNGRIGKIQIEIFKQAVNKLLSEGAITRDYINQNYAGRASSGIVLILAQVPFFKLTKTPIGLKYDYSDNASPYF